MLGLSKFIQTATGKYSTILLLVFLGVETYFLIRPSVPPLDEPRAEVANDVARQVADALGRLAANDWASRYVRIARFQGDRYDHVRARIENELPSRTNCRLVTDSVFAEMRDNLAAKAGRLGVVSAVTADGMQAAPVTSLAQALELAQEEKLDYVVCGRVEDFRVELGRAYLRVTVEVADAKSRAIVFTETFESGNGAVFAGRPAQTISDAPRRSGLRIAGWILFVILLPLGTGWFWKRLLDRESNFVNVICLLFLTAIDAFLAWALIGFDLSTAWLWIFFLIATGAAATWNLFILNVLERSREAAKFAV